jgi:hypothetical protein
MKLIGSCILAAALAFAQASAEVELKAAMNQEQVRGDLKGAIAAYRKIIARHAGNRTVAAQAMLLMAQCHEKLGEGEARKIYEQIVKAYADQTGVVAQARARLGGSRANEGLRVRQFDPAGPGCMPQVLGARYTDCHRAEGIFVRDLKSGQERLVVPKSRTNGRLLPGAFSPDEKTLVYFDTETGMRAVGIDGSGDRALGRTVMTPLLHGLWTRDGRRLLMMVPGDAAGANPQLALIDIADGKRQVLKLAYGSYMSAVKPGSGAVLLSPDERFVALSRSANLDDGSIVVFPLDGGPAVGVTGTGRVARLVGWHSSGRLLYTSDRAGGAVGIWSIAINGGKPSGDPELVHGGHHPQERPWLGRDGALHYEQWGGLSLVQTATLDAAAGTLSAPKPSTKLFASGNWAPDFSPDGKFLMYTTAYSPGTVKFVIKDLASGNETAYQAPFRTVPNRVLWYPDGSALLVPAIMDRGQETVLYRFVPATGEAKPLLTLGSEQIARAGRYAYVVEKGKPGIQKLDLASGERQPVTLPGSPGNATPLAVASDGSRIAYGYVTGANPGSMPMTKANTAPSMTGPPFGSYR